MAVTVEQIKNMIDQYFGDTSRTKRETVDGLEEICSHADISADALREELRREGE